MPLSEHGPIDCRLCWSEDESDGRGFGGKVATGEDKFRAVNDPGAWGCSDPVILVLGMSKGETQSRAMRDAAHNGTFDRVPFKDMRPNLLKVLQSVGLMQEETDIERRFIATEPVYGWGSIVRCSLTGWTVNPKTGKAGYSASSTVVVPAMKKAGLAEGRPMLPICLRRYLGDLPERTRLVILLGNADNYMELLRKEFSRLFPDLVPGPGHQPVHFTAGGRAFVHVGHPSRGNGYLNEFLTGNPGSGQGAKREAAREAVRNALGPDGLIAAS